MEEQSYFNILNSVDLNSKKKEKGSLTYVSWAYAWGELKKKFPDATYKVYERDQVIRTVEEIKKPRKELDLEKALPEQNEEVITIIKETTIPINYFTDGRTCWVKVGVTVEGIEHIEELPVMDNRNKSIASNMISSTDVNKSIQRALTKAIARHGLGLYIYANEDLPDNDDDNIAFKEDAVQNEVVDKEKLFIEVRDEVIAYISKFMGTDKEKEVSEKIKGLFPNTRISQTTSNDLNNLIAARDYLKGLSK